MLPQSKKKIVATSFNLFLMESLSKMNEINLPVIMIEHMIKIFKVKDGRYGMMYGYILGRVFNEIGIQLG